MDFNEIINKVDFEKKYVELDFNRGLSEEKCREIENSIYKQRDEGFSEIHIKFFGLMAGNVREVPDTFESILIKLKAKNENKAILLKKILEDILEITDSFNLRSHNISESMNKTEIINIEKNY